MQVHGHAKATMVLNPVISKLTDKLVVLASASPRRLEILSNVGLRFEVVPSRFKENLDKGVFKAPHEYAVETAKQKALEVARRMLSCHRKTPDMVIGADTIVTIDGVILEKPVDKQDAYRMLSRLSGKEHSVFTGVAIVLCHEKENEVDCQVVDFHEETKVKFAELSENMLWEYISSGEPMDKAGGYGIQALGGMLVEHVHGDFLNVVGFPLNHFCKQLDQIYNRSTSSLDGQSLSVCHNSATNPDLPVQFTHSSSSSVKHNPSCLPESPSTNQTQSTEEIPFVNPIHKVKRTCREMEAGESCGTVANNPSKDAEDREAESQDRETTTSPQMTRVGRGNELEVTEELRQADLQRMIELLEGFRASKTLFTASKMCVFDVLQSRPGLDAAQVAREIKASVKGTERLLEACVSLGLLKSNGGMFENTDLAASFLLSDSPFPLQCYIHYCDARLWPLFSHLESAVLDGAGQHDKAFSKTPKDALQASLSNSQEARLRFMKAMHSYAKVTGKAVATAFDLSNFKTACDLGGCTGAIAYEIAKAHPGLSVTVFDLPAVVELSERFRPLHTDGRVSFVAGDFFEDDLPKADLYILARILHDWPDEKVHILLSKISDICTPGSGILLSEIFLDEDRGGPSRGLLQALSMTEGKQRSATEYCLLLKSHGFTPAHVTHTGNFLDAMLCIKA